MSPDKETERLKENSHLHVPELTAGYYSAYVCYGDMQLRIL